MYIKTEHFYIPDIERVEEGSRKRGYKEEWSIITPFQQEIKMYNVIENKYAHLRYEWGHIVVDYSRGDSN